MSLDIHKDIYTKLNYFLTIKKIPNIIFYGPSGSGKGRVIKNFIREIYQGKTDLIKQYVIYVNCAHGKGIKFIREELKFFAKTNINSDSGNIFKSIILLNADKLTIDAQSALRRCIELFSFNTRFFIIVEDKYKLLKPILSRFCDIYICNPIIDGRPINLHQYKLKQVFPFDDIKKNRKVWLKRFLFKNTKTHISLIDLAKKLYEKAYSAMDLMDYLENNHSFEEVKKYEFLMYFHKIKKEFRNEKLLMLFMLNFIFIRSDYNLENIAFM